MREEIRAGLRVGEVIRPGAGSSSAAPASLSSTPVCSPLRLPPCPSASVRTFICQNPFGEIFSGVGTGGCSLSLADGGGLLRQPQPAWLLPEEGRQEGAGGPEDARRGPQPQGCGVARRQVKVKRRALRSTAGPGTAAAAGTGDSRGRTLPVPGSGAGKRQLSSEPPGGETGKAQGSRGGGSELGSAGGRCGSCRLARPSASRAATAPCLPCLRFCLLCLCRRRPSAVSSEGCEGERVCAVRRGRMLILPQGREG